MTIYISQKDRCRNFRFLISFSDVVYNKAQKRFSEYCAPSRSSVTSKKFILVQPQKRA